MLHLIKKGSKLEEQELNKVLGAVFGNCGTYGCDNCGTNGNDETYDESYHVWYSEVMEQH